jgi:hypothetical protein
VLAKLEFHDGANPPPLLAGTRCRARWHNSSGLTAADLMTTPAATIPEHALPPVAASAGATLRAGLRWIWVQRMAFGGAGVSGRRVAGGRGGPMRLR